MPRQSFQITNVRFRDVAATTLQTTADILKELKVGEPRLTFDYVIIQMDRAVPPLMVSALAEFDLEPPWGTAAIILAPVADSQAFQLNHKQAHFIKFYRDAALGWYHSWQGVYNFQSEIDPQEAKDAMGEMLCGPWTPPRDGCVSSEQHDEGNPNGGSAASGVK